MIWRNVSRLGALAAAMLAYGAMVIPATAMSVTPIHVEMTSVGGKSRAQVTVHNDSKEPMPVETSLGQLLLGENGDRKIVKSDNEFLVFPPQAMIPPGGTQVFRLQWVGDPMLAESKSYMLNVSQVPVKLPKGQSKLQVVMSFGVVVNVGAQQATPALKVVGSGITADKQGKRRAFVTVENPSKHHALLPDGQLSLTGGNWRYALTPAEMREKIGIGLVQPGKRRKFVVPIDLPAGVTAVQASLDYKPKR